MGKGDGFRYLPSRKAKRQRLDFTNPLVELFDLSQRANFDFALLLFTYTVCGLIFVR